MPMDVALLASAVPAGDHELLVRYRSTRFAMGLAISIASWLIALGAMAWAFRRRSATALP